MRRYLFFVGAVVLATGFLGCPDTTTNPAPTEPAPTNNHVYISGKVGTTSSSTIPVYWKDDTLNYLPLSAGFTNGWASGIAVDSAGTVYVSGGQWGATTMYGYWEGSTFVELSLGSYAVCWDNGIAVDTGGNVWVAAIVGDSSPPTINIYWKNSGTPASLTGCTNKWGLGADTLGNVYFLGTTGGSSNLAAVVDYDWAPAYWKNGAGGMSGPTALPLTGGNTNGYAGEVAMDDSGNFYTCGAEFVLIPPDEPGVPVYWKNEESPVPLPLGAYAGYEFWGLGVIGIDASGTLHVVGRIGPTAPDFPVYWNGAASDPTPLPLGSNAYWNIWNEAGSVDAQGNFFVAGSVGSSESATIPVYWKNGSAYVELPMGPSNSFGQACSAVAEP